MDNRKRILEVATELFRSYGIKAVTMDSLANSIGMSKRTIYEVFSDKDDIIIGVLKSMADEQKLLVARLLDNSENAISAIFRLLEINRDYYQSMSPVFHSDLKKFHHEVLMKRADKCEMPDYRNNIALIERGRREKLFRDEINADLVNRCLFSLGRSILDNDLYPFELYTRKEVIQNVFINYLRGISTSKGVELINSLEAGI